MKYYYLIHIQFLGFRYHGWQKQPEFKTIQGVLEDCIGKILETNDFKTLGASRTDSMVSAQNSFFELICEKQIKVQSFVMDLNTALPPDIKILKCEMVDREFKIISTPKMKEYLYFFSYGEKNHPFSAPFITHINEELNIDLMMQAAQVFTGEHNFKNFCYKPSANQNFNREIILSEIKKNDVLTANFFPEKSFLYRVQARSFMRHQVRLMMGAIFKVGMKQMSLSDLKNCLGVEALTVPMMIAPASGLMLNQVTLD